MYNFFARLANAVFKSRGKFIIEGKENLPDEKGYVIACTHRSWVDVVALGAGVFPEQIHFMAKKELFEKSLAGKFLTSINAFPVNRENPGTSTLKIPLQLLRKGKTVGIFPSGTRSSEEASLKRGAVTIASMAKTVIVPAAFYGPESVKALLSGKPILLKIGQPIDLSSGKKDKDELSKITMQLSETMLALEEELKSNKISSRK
ncbi:lysophospholipid acyltransferase family protein [Bacillus infantis]|uniref:lysophospholipid acyltransferase family protein n=1 Tax=Bacillus infantis TaxID=324767 RepID=UPI00384DB9C2